MSPSLLRVPLSLLAISLLSSPLAVAASAVLEFDVPAASLEKSLNVLARQANAQILFAGGTAAGKQSPALKGRYTVEQALQQFRRDAATAEVAHVAALGDGPIDRCAFLGAKGVLAHAATVGANNAAAAWGLDGR